MSTPRTPPLPALRAFAAWVQLGSVPAVAQALSLTPGAVGHQIRALETHLGVALIEREGKKWVLTESGRIYGYQVRQALQDIAEVTERVQQRPRQNLAAEVHVAVLPSLAQGWLLPRLPDFVRWHPALRVHLHSGMGYAPLGEGRWDCAIRFGHGQWPELQGQRLMGDRLMLLAQPQWLAQSGAHDLRSLLQLPLLQASENWSSWLADADPTLSRPPPRLHTSDSTHLLQAAALGMGVALSRRSIADHLLTRGELVAAHPHQSVHASAYHVLWSPQRPPQGAVQAFIDWVLACGRRFEQDLQAPLAGERA